MLDNITRGITIVPPRFLVYGTEGVGKSTFAASAPSPIFIPCEEGVNTINTDKFPLAQSDTDVVQYLYDLLNEDHNYSTVVIDTMDALERLIFDTICREEKAKTIEQACGGYGKGYVMAASRLRIILGQLDQLRAKKNMAVILLAQAKIEKYNDPENTGFDRYSPRLSKGINQLSCEWPDAILLATRMYGAAMGESANNERILRCVGMPNYVAKNRYGFPEKLPLLWAAVENGLAKFYNKEY